MNSTTSVYDQFLESIPTELHMKVKEIFMNLITKQISKESALEKCNNLVGSEEPVKNLLYIMDVPEEPIPSLLAPNDSSMKKVRNWTSYEDQRLIAGVSKFGTDDWKRVCAFVGNNRNKLQCLQRWQRSINPLINKGDWTMEEDVKLIESVKIFGEKKWTKVSQDLIGRTDVQCRYRYQVITKRYPKELGIDSTSFVQQKYNVDLGSNSQQTSEKSDEETLSTPDTESAKEVPKPANTDVDLFAFELTDTDVVMGFLQNIASDPYSLFSIY